MNERYFLFLNGQITEVSHTPDSKGKRLYFQTAPRNFLEISDELKKLSFICDGVYVAIQEKTMQIFFEERDSLELFTKLVLSAEAMTLPVNERLKDFLFQHVNE